MLSPPALRNCPPQCPPAPLPAASAALKKQRTAPTPPDKPVIPKSDKDYYVKSRVPLERGPRTRLERAREQAFT